GRVARARVLDEAVPRAEDVADLVGVRPVLARQPVLRARDLARQQRPAEQREEVVGLLDVVHRLAQAYVALWRAALLCRRRLGRVGRLGVLGYVGRAVDTGRWRRRVLARVPPPARALAHGTYKPRRLGGLGAARQPARHDLRHAVVAHRDAV